MRFFFYGTLMAGNGNAVAEAVHRKLDPGVPAVARGRLYAIPDPQGWYPAFVPDAAGGEVHGFVHETGPGFGPTDLALLDDYEGCLADDPAGSDYMRQEVALETSGGTGPGAETYVWSRPLPGAVRPIGHGSFLAFLAETGLPGFGEAD